MSVETKPALLLHPSSFLRLKAAVSQPNQPILLAGPPNVGKLNAAKWLAEEIVGPRWQNQAIIIEQSDKGTISIDKIHEVRRITRYRSANANDRVVVIVNDAHTMGTEAQNSFLKLLEEPPADVYIVLLTWQPNKLLQTIRSRVTSIDIQPPSFEQVIERFHDQNEALLKKLYLMTNGSPVLIEELLEDREHSYSQNIARAKTLVGQSAYERLLQVDELTKDKTQIDELLSGVEIILLSALNNFAEQGKSIKSILPKLEAVQQARTSLRKNHNTKLTLTLLFTSL